MKRSQTFYVNVAANTTEQQFTPPFNDKVFNQSFSGCFCNYDSAGVLLTIYNQGRAIASFDGLSFSIAGHSGAFEVMVQAQQQLTFSITDKTGTGKAVTGVTFYYDIPNGADGSQPR